MSTVTFECGCSITSSMYEPYEVLAVRHCLAHYYLYSQNKTIKQMAEEIRAVQRQMHEGV